LTASIIADPGHNHHHHAHVHGKAAASGFLSNSELSLRIIIPAESVVGFEHTPSTAEEKQLIAMAKATLLKPPIFILREDQGWFKKSMAIPLIIKENTVSFTHDNHHHPEANHSEFTVDMRYEFSDTQTVSEIQTDLFNRLPHLEQINLQLINNESQTLYRLYRDKELISI